MLYLFEDYALDTGRRELRRGEGLLSVEPKVFDLLVHLIANRERVISKDDLIAAVWGGRIVSDSTLTSCINAARTAIGDSGEAQRLIRTLPRKGIRFVGSVRAGHGSESARAIGRVPSKPSATNAATVDPALLGLVDKPSIAVLPFTNMSGDPEQEYFSDGITEDIITALSRLPWFFVIARNSTFAYKGKAVDVRQLGRDLGVQYLLEGSVRKSGQRLRITSQLLDATSGNHLWSERYDRELTDMFTLQDEITQRVAASIEPKLVAAEGARAQQRSTDELDAWDLVARALVHFWKLTAAESGSAVAILRQAVKRHPDYGPAHSLLAFAMLLSGWMGWTSAGSDRELASGLARRAAQLDDSDPWAHFSLGFLALTNRRVDEAIRYFEAALDLNPNFAAALDFCAYALAFDGRSEEAIRRSEQALRMSPRDPFNTYVCGGIAAAHYVAHRYEDAIKWIREAIRLRPEIPGLHRMLCASLAQAGRVEEAKAAMKVLLQLQPDISITWIRQSVPYAPDPMEHFIEGMRKAGVRE